MHLMPAGLISLSANGHGHGAALPLEFIMENQTHTHTHIDLGEGPQIFQAQSGRRFRRGDRQSQFDSSRKDSATFGSVQVRRQFFLFFF